jgi:hypothetical protein
MGVINFTYSILLRVELILIGSSALAAVDDSTFVKREDYPTQVVNNLKNLMCQYNNLLLLTEF